MTTVAICLQVCEHNDQPGTNVFERGACSQQRVLSEQTVLPADTGPVPALRPQRPLDLHQRPLRLADHVPPVQALQGPQSV